MFSKKIKIKEEILPPIPAVRLPKENDIEKEIFEKCMNAFINKAVETSVFKPFDTGDKLFFRRTAGRLCRTFGKEKYLMTLYNLIDALSSK